jgi:hypothetical protein
MKNLLIPKKCIFKKARFGPTRDGGYIFAKTNLKNQKIYGFGVGNEIDCEIDLHEYFKGPVNLFDGTCDYNNILPNNFTYNKVNITKDNINNLLKNDTNIIVKMDIEGSEFECLHSIESSILNNIEQLVIEFHLGYSNINFFYSILQKIDQTHKVIHIHGNNCCGLNAVGLPNVLEVSYINKNICNLDENDTTNIPVMDLDYKNLDYHDELNFQWW